MLRPTFIPLLLLLPLLTCCVEDDKEDTDDYYVLVTPPHPVASGSKILTSGRWLVYLADEATYGADGIGTDMNGDGDELDAIAVRVDVYTNQRTELNTAVQDMALVNGTLFLVVLEASDGFDWNADSDTDDQVLLYQTPADTSPTFLAETDVTSSTVLVGLQNQAFFTSYGVAAPANGEPRLFATSVLTSGSIPTVPVSVPFKGSSIPETTPIRILDEAEDVLFLAMNEDSEIDLNDDGDQDDSKVLALLDCSSVNPEIVSTKLALDPLAHSLAATTSGSDRIVAFLVNETAQGDTNLNNPADFSATWQPPQCGSFPDNDSSDDVLHWLLMADFEAGGVIQNTGLVGTAGEHVYAHPAGFVGCASLEADEGGCDLNSPDGDAFDRIFRWIAATNPAGAALPATDKTILMALVTTVPGAAGDSTGGVLTLGNLWVLLVDEAADSRDHDGDGLMDKNLIGAKDPSLVGQSWNFFHSPSKAVPAGFPVGVTWMTTDIQTNNRNLMAIEESVTGIDQNDDGDLLDSFPTFPKVQSGSVLTFPGIALAVSSTNAGIVTAAGVGYFRVSEAAHGGTDFNADGDATDFTLRRVGVTTSEPSVHMGTLNSLARPAVQFDSESAPKFGVMLFQESMQGLSGTDINNDGDANDFVPRYFLIDN